MKLSIIIPVYNVAPYVRKCVESVLNQDLDPQEYEVILVDDGSTDGSGTICDEFAQSTINVIHQPNVGLSMARNAGIAVAKGKYIQFVDSDDYLEPNVLGGLVAQMERENLDVLRFDYQNVRINPQNGEYEVFEPYKTPRQVDQCTEIVCGETYLNTRMGYGCYAWQFLLRRSLLADCVFTPGIHFEDVEWTPRMLLTAKRVNSTTAIVYNYLLREGSITGTMNIVGKRRNLEDSLDVEEKLGALYAQYPRCTWLKNMQSSMVCGTLCTIATCFYAERKTYLRRIRQMHVLPLRIDNQGRTYIRRARIINFCPKAFLLIMKLRHRL